MYVATVLAVRTDACFGDTHKGSSCQQADNTYNTTPTDDLSAAPESKSKRTMSFDSLVESAVDTGGLSGVALWAKHKSGKVLYNRALGVESLEEPDAAKRAPMSMDTVVRLASSSKLVTTIAALQAVEKGLIGLDDDVAKYVPELAEKEVLMGFTWYGKPLTRPRTPSETITLRTLLNQTAGAGYDFLKWQPLWRVRWWRSETVAGGKSLEERLSYPLLHDPSDGWTYGSSLSWAGRVVERASGMSLEAWVEQHIAKPLGLTTLTFFPRRKPSTKRRLAGLSYRSLWTGRLSFMPDREVAETNEQGEDVCMGGEDVCGSAADFCKILFSLLVDDGQLLTPATTAQMFTKQLNAKQREKLDECLDLPVWICRSILERGQYNWGLGGVLIDGDSKTGLQDGALMWSGLYHILWVRNIPLPDNALARTLTCDSGSTGRRVCAASLRRSSCQRSTRSACRRLWRFRRRSTGAWRVGKQPTRKPRREAVPGCLALTVSRQKARRRPHNGRVVADADYAVL